MNVIRVYDPTLAIGARQGYAAQIDCSRIEGLFITKVMIPLLSGLIGSSSPLNIGPMTGQSPSATMATGDWLIVWDDGIYQTTSNLSTFAGAQPL